MNFNPEFDLVYMITGDKQIGLPIAPVYAPEATYNPLTRRADCDWSVLSGYSVQNCHSGNIMHPSEQWGAWAESALAAIAVEFGPIAFAVVEVRDEDGNYPDDSYIGWAVVYTYTNAYYEG